MNANHLFASVVVFLAVVLSSAYYVDCAPKMLKKYHRSIVTLVTFQAVLYAYTAYYYPRTMGVVAVLYVFQAIFSTAQMKKFEDMF